MNRLQKKCVIATAGLHLLLLAILVFGPAFFNREPKNDNLPVLDVIPANLIDAAFMSGVKAAAPPPPQPVTVSQPPPPQPVQPVPKPVQPAPAPKPTFENELKKFFTPAPKPEPVQPAPQADESQPHKIVVNTQLVTRAAPRYFRPENTRNDAKALNQAITSLSQDLSSATKIDMPGTSSVAYANYAAVVKSVYEQAWIPPDNTASDEANTKVSVTIASDGTVISALIIAPSGDANTDDSVQRTLDRVTFIAPFPEGTTAKPRNYIINFNLKAKRMLE
ncbi:MAG TPA: TonB family protein [Verrucomicrobiae bacterium]|nr:TonB family protein [Verrucomicrobiae bacterium]